MQIVWCANIIKLIEGMILLTQLASNLQLVNLNFLLLICHSLVTVSQLGDGNPVKY